MTFRRAARAASALGGGRWAILVALLLGRTEPAAAQHSIAGAELVVVNATRGPEWRDRLVFRSTDPAITIPAPLGPDDPRCGRDPAGTGKAALQIFSQATGQLLVHRLPCSGWRAVGKRGAPSGYRYLDPAREHGPCHAVQVRRGRLLRAYCDGSRERRFALVKGRAPLPVDVQLVSGTLRLCAAFAKPSVVRRKDGSDGRRLVARQSPAPAICSCRVELADAKVDGIDGVKGLDGPTDVAMTADGLNVYVSSIRAKALSAFRRDPASGKLAFLETKTEGVGGVSGLDGAIGVAASPDGRSVYVTGFNADAIAVFSRTAATGRLAFVEAQRNGVKSVDGLDGATGIAVSPDGAHVYATGQFSNAVVVFARNRTSGKLSPVETKTSGRDGVGKLGGANGVAVSPDGGQVYVTALNDNALVVFQRDPSSGRLGFLQANVNGIDGVLGLTGANGVAISRDGSRVYVGSAKDDALVTFARDPANGRLTFLARTMNGTEAVTGLDNPSRPTLTPDGACLAVGAFKSGDVAVFDRTGLGTLRFVTSISGGSQGVPKLDAAAYGVASPDGRDLYAVAQRSNALVLLRREPAPSVPTSQTTGAARPKSP